MPPIRFFLYPCLSVFIRGQFVFVATPTLVPARHRDQITNDGPKVVGPIPKLGRVYCLFHFRQHLHPIGRKQDFGLLLFLEQ